MFVAWRSARHLTLAVALVVGVAGCGLVQSDNKSDEQKRNDERKTRDEVAKATERAKPELQKAGQELSEAAKTAAGQAKAAAQGLKEGWERGRSEKLDLNSANESELAALPGVTRRDARKIVAGRPYRDAHELVEKGILSDEQYARIRDDVSAK
jgi:DNA uptake protein ComE-like DNA-binding protein